MHVKAATQVIILLITMEERHQKLLDFIQDKQFGLGERLEAARLITHDVSLRNIGGDDATRIYRAMVQFWKSLGTLLSDRIDPSLFLQRSRLATHCMYISNRLPEGQKFYRYHPKIELAEGPNRFKGNQIIRGSISYQMYASVYEFHFEYPIEGTGVKKDEIMVITGSGSKISVLDWCEANDVIVFCNRCGLDITFEVSRNCPRRRT